VCGEEDAGVFDREEVADEEDDRSVGGQAESFAGARLFANLRWAKELEVHPVVDRADAGGRKPRFAEQAAEFGAAGNNRRGFRQFPQHHLAAGGDLQVLMDVGALRDGDEGDLELRLQARDCASVGKEPGGEDNVEGKVAAQLVEHGAQGTGVEAMIEPVAEFWKIRNRHKLGVKRSVLGPRLPAAALPRQRGTQRDHTNIDARIPEPSRAAIRNPQSAIRNSAKCVQQRGVIKATIRFAGIREKIADEKQTHRLFFTLRD
jgi:hypothetical protein